MDLKPLFKRLNIQPKKYSLYLEAFTHISYANDIHEKYNYERLEFLGDAIISQIICEYLFEKKPQLSEGEMSQQKILIVQSKSEIYTAKKLNLSQYILLGKSLAHDSNHDKILEDVFEALIAAIYLDLGYLKAKEVIKNTLIKYFEQSKFNKQIDYKSKIQELFRNYSQNKISYKLVRKSLNDCVVELWYGNVKQAVGEGKRIKDAQQNAAKKAYQHFSGINSLKTRK